ncbi:75fc1077-f955-4e64-8beb-cd1ebfd97997 [Sclerotinia trifoliorum]|uniref:75fc1077-f955-4e64-8beb-cd1ebfd97997 n=1 Tax=Sclerotinia trifoliorum TaxID=28548 RepID=A0A8H2ZRT4_9HELO|nr:75fc1077-f955-4e64-8beb-cd1ebfd97997 [Sclerotinia trifoliorum]
MTQFFSRQSHLNFQQSQQNLTIVVPLVKFSCSLVNQGSTTGIQWSHYLRNDLELVIQEMQAGGSGNEKNLMMKVVAGAEYLEEQNLDDMARIYKDFIPSPGSRTPVDVVVKRPLLALRYPKLNNIRRIQFRFRDDSDFNRIVNTLKSLGLMTTESISPAPAFQSYPSTTSSSSSPISMVHPTPTAEIYIPSPQNTEFKVPMRPDSATSTLRRPISSNTSRSDDYVFSSPQPAISITSFMPHSKPSIETLKKKQALYTSQIEREQVETQPSNFIVPSSNDIPPSQIPYRSPIFLPNPDESQRRFSTSHSFETRKTQCLPDRLASFSLIDGTNNLRHNGHGSVLDSSSPFECRPLARPAEYPIFSAIGKRPISLPTEHDICSGFPIPPKRQLPFATVKNPSRSESVFATETNQSVEASGHRKRSLGEFFNANSSNRVTIPTDKSTKRRSGSRKATHLPEMNDRLTKPVPSKDVSAGDSLGFPILPGEPFPPALRAFTAPSTLDLPPKLPEKGFPATERLVSTPLDKPTTRKMVERSTQTQTLSGRDHTAALKSAQNASVVEPPSNFPTAFVLQEDLDLFISRYSSRSRISLPPNYDKVPAEERHKILNDFIIKNLENEDFFKMAQDTDVSWRRKGLTR